MVNVSTALVAVFALSAVACDLEPTASAPTSTCTEAGSQCQLSAGPLGVCERLECRSGETPPCFQCTPQH